MIALKLMTAVDALD